MTFGLPVATILWQPIQVDMAGTVAAVDLSALLWQYKQGILLSPA